eukprot:7323-Pyramimonas_sp.AAC.1
MRQRPCAEGLEWPRARPVSDREYEAAKNEDGKYGPDGQSRHGSKRPERTLQRNRRPVPRLPGKRGDP